MLRFLHGENQKQKKYSLILRSFYSILLLFAIIAPLIVGRYYVSVLTLICIYAILSVGFNIAYGFCGMMTFSAGAIFGFGAYTCGILISLANMPTLLAMLCGVISSGLISFLISLASYKVSGTYLTLVSYGLLEVFQRVVIELYEYTGGTSGLHIPKWEMFGNVLSKNAMFYIILGVLVFVLIIQRNIYKSQWGRDFISIKDNQVAASGVGICPPRMRVIGFLIASLITGIAGVLYVNYTAFISPETFSFNTSVLILLMVLAGGKGTLTGPIVGAIVIYCVPMLFNEYPDVKQLFYGGMLIVLIQIMPKGICGIIKKYCKEIENHAIEDDNKTAEQIFKNYHVDSEIHDDVMRIKGLTKSFIGLEACSNLDMVINKGTVHALIGPNGAGKTTFINNVTGIDFPTSGSVFYNGQQIIGKKTWDIAGLGISRTYQHVQLMNNLSVLDNIVMGARMKRNYFLFDALLQTKKKRKIDEENYKDAMECLSLVGLADKANHVPDSLSSGQQKLLEICRALVAKPQFMLLDEPCAGLTETETKQFADIIRKIRDVGITILLVEHHMSIIAEVSDYVTVIDHGIKIFEGIPSEALTAPIVKKSYLGE